MPAPDDSLSSKIEIQELAARYADHCDHHAWQSVVDLFTADAVFDADAVYGRIMTGPAEILAFFEEAPAAVAHHPTSIHSSVEGPDTANARMKMLVLFKRNVFSVDYEWQLARVDEAWRIARQGSHVVGRLDLPKSLSA
jgi:ketosteroid isomerase-like protein